MLFYVAGSGTTIAVLVMVGAVIILTVVAVYFIYKLKLSRLKVGVTHIF